MKQGEPLGGSPLRTFGLSLPTVLYFANDAATKEMYGIGWGDLHRPNIFYL